jgi:D-sedoheptulose 7-phosphate isomerase
MIFERLDELNEVINEATITFQNEIIDLNQSIEICKNYLKETKKNNGITYVVGNGGSSGIASHFSNDLIKALKIPSATLVDSNVLTCLANDFGYEYCYSEALKVNLKSNDLLVAISSSGNSKNIINAVNVAKDKNVKVISLSGFEKNNILRSLGDINFYLEKKDYGLVEMGHFFILHSIVDLFFKNNLKQENLTAVYNE